MKICLFCNSECNDKETVCSACGGREFGTRCKKCGQVYEGKTCPNCKKEKEKENNKPPKQEKTTKEKPKKAKKVIDERTRNLYIVLGIGAVILITLFVFGSYQVKKQVEQQDYIYSVLAETTTEAPPENVRDENEFFYDGGYLCIDGWDLLTNAQCRKLNTAMRDYYGRTGVAPYILITYDTDLVEEEKIYALYDNLFSDETHLLIVYVVTDEGADWHSLRGAEVYDLVEQGSFSGLADALNETYSSPAAFVSALADFFGEKE